jgi:hypothetical protein
VVKELRGGGCKEGEWTVKRLKFSFFAELKRKRGSEG